MNQLTPSPDGTPITPVPMSAEVANYAATQAPAGEQIAAGPQVVPPSAEGVAHMAAQNTLVATAADVRDDVVMEHAVRSAEDQFGALVKRTDSAPLAEEGGSTGSSVSVANQPIQPTGSDSIALAEPTDSGAVGTSELADDQAAGPKVLAGV